MRKIIPILSLAVLSACATTNVLSLDTVPTPVAAPVINRVSVHVVNRDLGGKVIDYVLRRKQFIKDGIHVKFNGYCASACTLYLGMPEDMICVTPNAKFYVHKPYGAGSVEANRRAYSWVYREYPTWVKRWIDSVGGLRTDLVQIPPHIVANNVQECI